MSRTFNLNILNTQVVVSDYINIAGARILSVHLFGKDHEATATELVAGGLVVSATLANNMADEGYRSVVLTLPPTSEAEGLREVTAGVVFLTTYLTAKGPSSEVESFRAVGTVEVVFEVP
jgi:hypothetical protein